VKTILIDLDGVLNEYNGLFNSNVIPKPRKNTYRFLKILSQNYELKLFTSRNLLLASKWLFENNLDKYFTDITNKKEPYWLYIDDRCIHFDGKYNHTLKQIKEFNVWYK